MTEDRTAIVRDLSAPLFASKGWMKLLGVVFIIQGILVAVTLIGIVIAWLPIWIGMLLFQSSSAIEKAHISGDETQFRYSISKLHTYFAILGVLSLISIVATSLMVIGIFFGVFSGIMSHSLSML